MEELLALPRDGGSSLAGTAGHRTPVSPRLRGGHSPTHRQDGRTASATGRRDGHPSCRTLRRQRLRPVLAGHQQERLFPGLPAQRVCGEGREGASAGGPQGRAAGGSGLGGILTVEGGEGRGRLAAEVVVFVVRVGVGVLGSGKGCDQRVWGVRWEWGGCHQPGPPAPRTLEGPVTCQTYLVLWEGWGAAPCSRWRSQRACWGSGHCGSPAPARLARGRTRRGLQEQGGLRPLSCSTDQPLRGSASPRSRG